VVSEAVTITEGQLAILGPPIPRPRATLRRSGTTGAPRIAATAVRASLRTVAPTVETVYAEIGVLHVSRSMSPGHGSNFRKHPASGPRG
jgi:hypothetical protein